MAKYLYLTLLMNLTLYQTIEAYLLGSNLQHLKSSVNFRLKKLSISQDNKLNIEDEPLTKPSLFQKLWQKLSSKKIFNLIILCVPFNFLFFNFLKRKVKGSRHFNFSEKWGFLGKRRVNIYWLDRCRFKP